MRVVLCAILFPYLALIAISPFRKKK